MPRTAKTRPMSKAARERRRSIQSAQATYQAQEKRYRDLAAKSPENSQGAAIYQKAAEQIAQRREALRGIDVRKPSTMTADQKFFISDAKNFRVSTNSDEWQRGETLGRLRLSGTTLGHNFFAATQTLWEGVPYNRRLDAIRKAFGKNPEIRKKYGARPNADQLIDIVSEFFSDRFFDESETLAQGSPPDRSFMRGVRQIIKNYG